MLSKEELINLSKDRFIPGTYQIDIGRWIAFDGLIRLDLSTDPPSIHREKNFKIEISEASDEQMEILSSGISSLPKLRPVMYIYEVHALFTPEERSAIRGVAPDFVEMLLMADDPIDTSRIVPFLTQLNQFGILSNDRFKEIVGG